MAISGSNSRTISAPYGSFTLSVSWSESNSDVSTNKSKISATATLSSSNTAFASDFKQHISVYWYDNKTYTNNGLKIDGTDFYSCGMSPYGSVSASDSVNVSHKDDGSLKGYCVAYVTFDTAGPYAPSDGEYSCSTSSKDLTTIARASVPTVSPSTLTIGSSGATLTIDTHRKSSTFMHTIKVKCGSWSWQSSARSVGASTTCTVPYSVIGQFGSSDKTKTATVYCDTYNGTTHIGDQKSCTATFQIDTSYDYVTINSVTITDTNQRTSEITQDNSIMISNISTLQAVVACGTHGSYTTLYHAVVTCGNVSQTFPLSGTSDSFTFTFDKVNASSLRINLMSNRSTGTTRDESWTLIQYSPVTASNASVQRLSPTDPDGTGQVVGMAYGGNFGATPNKLTVLVDFKLSDAQDYEQEDQQSFEFPLPTAGYNQYDTGTLEFNYQFDYRYQYDVRFTVKDLFSDAEYTCQMMQGLPILSWDNTEVDVFGELHIHDREDPYKFQSVLDGFDAVLEYYGIKNLTPMTTATKTENGITFTKNTTYYNINGTATANAYCNCSTTNYMETGGRYILSGLHDQYQEGMAVIVRYVDSSTEVARAYRDDVEFTAPAPCYPFVVVFQGTTVNNKRWYPMIRDARIKSEDYVRYVPSNYQLNTAINTLGALLTIREYHYEGNLANNGGSYNRTFTLSGKGVVIFSMFLWSSTANDTGQLWADVQQMNSAGSGVVRFLGYSGNRLASSSTFQNGANAMGVVYMDGSGSNNKIRIRCSSTKNGVAPWKCHIVSFGCTVS